MATSLTVVPGFASIGATMNAFALIRELLLT